MSNPVLSKSGLTRDLREKIAWEVIRRVDTVTLCTPEEVKDIHARAQAGELDDIFDDEKMMSK